MKKRKEKKTIKQLLSILCIAILCSVILLGCSIPAGGTVESKKSQYIEKNDSSISNDSSITTKSIGSYPRGKAYYDIESLNYGNSKALVDKYNQWKSIQVVSSGANGYLRVKRDPASSDDTVSEGIGYGMLLAVYFNDQATFDGLYKYCKYHFIKVNGTTVPLMHWKVDAAGNNVSEFADYMLDDTKINNVPNTRTYCTSYKPNIPHDIVYGNLTNGKIFIVPYNLVYTEDLKKILNSKSNYYPMCKETRGYSSATDADEDIAAALCFASKRGWSGSINYSQEATNMINAMKQYDFMSDGFIKNGNTWGGQNGWNPSYFAPGYYINVYQKHTGDSFWTTVYNRMYTEMSIVKNIILYRNGNNESKVFFPDWCDTSNSGLKKATNTDRLYYNNVSNESQPSNKVPFPYTDARWMDNTTKEDYKSSFISFNAYYDGIRVPWRIATDYLWGGTRAAEIMPVINKSFQNYFNYNNTGNEMGDGCSITGGPWNPADRDGFNRSGGGGNKSSVFRYMAATSQVIEGVYSDPKFSNIRSENIFEGPTYYYYSNCMNLFGELILSGKFQNLYDPAYSAPQNHTYLYRYYAGDYNGVGIKDHLYTIDFNELGYGRYGYAYEGYEGFVYKTSVIDGGKTTALFRLYNYNFYDHYYTTNWSDVDYATKYCGYYYEGIACNVYTNSSYGGKPLYRYWSSGAGDHFYTVQKTDISGMGYAYEDIACYVKY